MKELQARKGNASTDHVLKKAHKQGTPDSTADCQDASKQCVPDKPRKQHYTQDTRSYYEQFQDLRGSTDLSVLDAPLPKPSPAANAKAPTAQHYPFCDVVTCGVQRPLLAANPKTLTAEQADWKQRCKNLERRIGMPVLHAIVLTGCWFTFTKALFVTCMVVWQVQGCLGITVGYHRLLTHRSFKTYKWVEYLLAYVGVLGVQGPPIEWVCNHRYHHLHSDTPLDVHSPYEGFWWAHMGWLLSGDVERPLLDRSNVQDLARDPFYRWLEKTWLLHLIARIFVTWAVFGWGAVVWTTVFPVLLGWHATFLVNSACHLWGRQPYDTGDLSRNNWVVAALAVGEGWHNNHHAFPTSARHGLEWYEFDASYCFIRCLEAVGLAWDLRPPPTEAEKARRRRLK